MFLKILTLFCVFISFVKSENGNNRNKFCRDFHPQMIFNFDMILGRWYAAEVLFHDKEENERVKYHSVCPIVHLTDVPANPDAPLEEFVDNTRLTNNKQHIQDQSHSPREELMDPLVKLWHETNQNTARPSWGRRLNSTMHREELKNFRNQTLQNLRIVWNEEGTRMEYTLKYNISKPGYWMSFGPQNASLEEQHHFIGTVQVLRAVRTHMVLTFCHITFRDQFFSVIFTRQPWMEPEELRNIRNFVQRKIPMTHMRKMCMEYKQSGGTGRNYLSDEIGFLAILIVLTRFVKSLRIFS